jgi:RNA polymerase sigma-70 factor, ECF subfamily
MNKQDHHSLFSELIGRHQSEIYAYIFSVVRNWEDADDLFQSVCLVLWSKFESFRPNSNFFAWARRTARITVSNFLKRKQLEQYASEELLSALTETTFISRGVGDEGGESYLVALRRCKDKLSAMDEELLELRYVEDLGSRQIADRLHRPQRSVSNSLARVQRWLFECIQTEMAQSEHSGKEHA